MAAAAGQSTVRDDLVVAVATLWRSAGVGASTVGLGWELSSSTVGTVVGAATCSFVVAVPGGRRLVDPVVNPHEVGVFSELGDDLPSANSLGLACDRRDRHEALLRGSVYSALDRLESFRKVADGQVDAEASATFAALPVTLTSSVSICGGLVCWSISRELVGGDVFKVLAVPEGPGVSPAAMKTWRSAVPRLDSEGATSDGVFESAWASSVPSWNGSELM
jgi:hypothetical protein